MAPVQPKDITKVHDEDLEHFSKIPLAKPTLDDPAFKLLTMSHYVNLNGTNHTLMSTTWNTPGTIAHSIALFRPSTSTDGSLRGAECRRIFTLGSMLNSVPDTLHGGVIATLLDSTIGHLVIAAVRDGAVRVTVQLDVSYKTPVKTPGTIMVRSWISRIEDGGRKVWMEGVLESGDDGKVVHARAVSLWMIVKPRPDKL